MATKSILIVEESPTQAMKFEHILSQKRILGNIFVYFQGLLNTHNERFKHKFASLEQQFSAIRGFSEKRVQKTL